MKTERGSSMPSKQDTLTVTEPTSTPAWRARSTEKSTARALCRRLLHWLKRKRRSEPPPPPARALNGTFGSFHTTKAKALSEPPSSPDRMALCATWPPLKVPENTSDGESGFEDDESEDDNMRDVPYVKEWSILFGDLKFGERVADGRHRAIYRGRWHGEVLIHTFTASQENPTGRFLHQVASLTMIRHENVALFMGACVESSCLAIVTSMHTAPSLHEQLHLKADHLVLSDKINIARQIAQGMGYLHAKGIVHRKLNSKNVFLESRVQVSLLDHGIADRKYDRVDYACLPQGHLTYVSPELMCSLHMLPPRISPRLPYTQQSDVYSFGTLLYELLTEKWPMQGYSSHSIIWNIGSGKTDDLTNIKCPTRLKDLLNSCWRTDAHKRPAFPKVVYHLQQSLVLQRRFSSSEPERLHRFGYGTEKLVC